MPSSASATSAPALTKHGIHVWHATLAATPENLAGAAEMLPATEREKTALVTSQAQRARLTLSRAWVRGILAKYLNQPAPDITIRRSAQGQAARGGRRRGDRAAAVQRLALRRSHARGGDALRRRGRGPRADDPAGRRGAHRGALLRPGEYDALLALPADQRADAFFRAWVRKESVVKALGTGIAAAFDAFTVPLSTVPSRKSTLPASPASTGSGSGSNCSTSAAWTTWPPSPTRTPTRRSSTPSGRDRPPYETTRLSSRFGTKITFRGVPVTNLAIAGSAIAASSDHGLRRRPRAPARCRASCRSPARRSSPPPRSASGASNAGHPASNTLSVVTERLPEFLGDVRRERRHQLHQRLHFARDAPCARLRRSTFMYSIIAAIAVL